MQKEIIISDELLASLEAKARTLRHSIVEMVGIEKKGHLGGSCSAADIVATLYFHIMNYKVDDPGWKDRDRFILSKGHAALAQYAALAEAGFFDKSEIKKVKTFGSILQGHPENIRTPGVEANTGSLGQGISIACGIAAGLKIDASPARVFCIVGDGELCEGQVWEAANAAKVHQLDNLYVFLDHNKLMTNGFLTDRYNIFPVREKWEAFGWHTQEIDGHNISEIIGAFEKASQVKGVPKIIISNTIKGKGVSFAENHYQFHNGTLTEEQYYKALEELSV